MTSSKPVIKVDQLVKYFRREGGAQVAAVNHVSLEVDAGECVVLLGPSGCGKTTLLRCLAGLEEPDSGLITSGDETYFDSARRINRPPERRRASMMFQSYALWPHMTAVQNVAFPLVARKANRADIAGRVDTMLKLVGIPELRDQYPNQMSGGQQQRVALARALVSGDPLVLFDEPLSNVDAKVRVELRKELVAMQADLGFSAVYVTHDQAEAMELADRIVVLDGGSVAQIGTPWEIYERPGTLGVATFIGAANVLRGVVTAVRSDVVEVDHAGQRVLATPSGDSPIRTGAEVSLVFRPERAIVTDAASTMPNLWRCAVISAQYLGAHTICTVDNAGHNLRLALTDPLEGAVGSDVWVGVEPRHLVAIATPDGAGGTDAGTVSTQQMALSQTA
ncbi:MAG TPA: ABC transporter ATP-binding protein [Amycolatopsis sp.]|nr:ABC transporter ATP-binding protein [Amycolatopsis sp.]